MSAEVGLTDAEQEALRDCWELGFRPIQITVARIKADAIAQERAAWVAKIEALAADFDTHPHTPECMDDDGWRCQQCTFANALRSLLSSDATAACACVCHSGGAGTGCRQSRCEVCPPATATQPKLWTSEAVEAVVAARVAEAEVRWMKVAVMRDGEAIREAKEQAKVEALREVGFWLEKNVSSPAAHRHVYAEADRIARATAALDTVREQAKAEERVHDHPPYRPACNERLVEGQLRGACLNDDGSEAGR